ncbi:hypothetical protein KAU11_08610 [Candidatus Babeliales bacterium]|nr:hypothetical protein [Candidatus Babeliales bacterium]
MITEDEKLLTWVDKQYPNFGAIIMRNSRGYWVMGRKYAKMPLIRSLSNLVGFDVGWKHPPSKKTYNRTIKKLRSHIVDNPDVILFALL